MSDIGRLLRDFIDTHHYVGEGWPAMDQPPQADQQGKPWWDTPETAADPEEEGEVPAAEAPAEVPPEKPRDMSRRDDLVEKARKFLKKKKG